MMTLELRSTAASLRAQLEALPLEPDGSTRLPRALHCAMSIWRSTP